MIYHFLLHFYSYNANTEHAVNQRNQLERKESISVIHRRIFTSKQRKTSYKNLYVIVFYMIKLLLDKNCKLKGEILNDV